MTKVEKVTRHLIDYKGYQMIREVLTNKRIYYLAGIGSIYVPSRREKYIISHNHKGIPQVMEWPDLDGEMLWMTPGEAARTELKREWPNLKRVGWPSKSVRLFDWRWPMYYHGNFQGEAVYTDLIGAYHQIYKRLWLDVGFTRGYGTLSLERIADRLGKWKQARNSLLGVTRSRVSYAYRGHRISRLSTKNNYLSPHLWATVQAVLNELAYMALHTGCIYCATDGYIHPVRSGVKFFQEALGQLGFNYRTEAGVCRIDGWGNYMVGTKHTQRFLQQTQQGTRPFRSLEIVSQNEPLLLTVWVMKGKKK